MADHEAVPSATSQAPVTSPDDTIQGDTKDAGLDPVEAVRLLRAKDAERDALIERYGRAGVVEQEMAAQLAVLRPLARPELFPIAYRRAMYAIEVLDRNGARHVTMPRLGPLLPLATLVVGLLTKFIVRSQQRRLIGDMGRLFSRREAIAEPMTIEHQHLRRARFHVTMLEPGYRGAQVGLPAFLAGGAILTALTSGIETVALQAFNTQHVGVIVFTALGLLLLGASWCALRAAGIARRRIRMATDEAMAELWTVIGSCGKPPRDQSFMLALVAIGLAVLSSLAVPFLLYVIVGL